ncbi:hypothetical protein RDB90_005201 [Salmonella enterica]|nr:hypothetical protein [Salmonella enterica subsp. enterica serovar Montevideo]EBU2832475.1 hypothetical protein [Salmonella enterica]EDS0148509.1 hypothetical protein [Salmonella enterica subsp. diarizonae]MJZ70847.1 hypothetical protein [Salmonella enterica subsp. enterica]EBY4631102.1 hypothetical protein [Salmonella enterica subsp. enterica serovar Montevideo]
MKLKNHNQIKELAKFLMAIVIAYFFFAAPANASTWGEMAQKVADQAKIIKLAGTIIAGVIAFFCVVGAGVVVKKKASEDPHAKLIHAVWLLVAAVFFGGAAFILATTGESVGVEMTTY